MPEDRFIKTNQRTKYRDGRLGRITAMADFLSQYPMRRVMSVSHHAVMLDCGHRVIVGRTALTRILAMGKGAAAWGCGKCRDEQLHAKGAAESS